MLIAKEKEKSNVAEYVLYMWQIEDVIRYNEFDLEQINSSIIEKFDVSDEVKYDMKLWYQNLIDSMMKEGIAEKGHLKLTLHRIEELNNLHNSLLTTMQDVAYQQQYIKTKENLSNFMQKTNGEASNEIHACFIGLYGFMLLKLKQAEISDSTKEAMNSFSGLLAVLVNRYNSLKKGELNLPKEKKQLIQQKRVLYVV